ncbi:hypothetical protein ACIQF6_01840 [Kitasatospora sp. NPDC092948]|uniref:hypothetical protein n=1 Tax=Kitasatospora sp. NPDC092948 TaxID=3364088 RepID=UPI003808054A
MGEPGPRRRRSNLMLRRAVPVGLAAAAAAAVFATGADLGSAPGHHTVAVGGSPSPLEAGQVAYTLQNTGEGTVALTVLNQNEPVDVARLQSDLDRLGVPSRVYAGEPGCQAPKPNSPPVDTSDAALRALNGDSRSRAAYFGRDISSDGHAQVLTVRPGALKPGVRLFIHLPLAVTSPENGFRQLEAGLMTDPAPACMPAATFNNPLADLYPSATAAPATVPTATPTADPTAVPTAVPTAGR